MDEVTEFDWTREAEEMESLRQEVRTAQVLEVVQELEQLRWIVAHVEYDALVSLLGPDLAASLRDRT